MGLVRRRHFSVEGRTILGIEDELFGGGHLGVGHDDGLVPGQIVAGIMHLPHVTDSEEHELGLSLRWSYGSAFGLWHGVLRRRLPEPWAAAAFGAYLAEIGAVVPPTRITITQGVDMGRPSTLAVDVPARRGEGVRVSGSAVPIVA